MLVGQPQGPEATLQSWLRLQFPQRSSSQPDAVEPAAIHRLDRHTSGIVLFGRTQRALAALSAMLRRGEIHKHYLLLAAGVPEPSLGRIELDLVENPAGAKRRMREARDDEDGIEAITEYIVEDVFDTPAAEFALIDAKPVTGRTHQLRVHFAAYDCPVAGDKMYGDKASSRFLRERAGLDRQFLHAHRLIFKHPVGGRKIDLISRLPADLAGVIAWLRAQDA